MVVLLTLSRLTHALQWLVKGYTFDVTKGRNVSIQSFSAAHSVSEIGGFVSTDVCSFI